MALKITDYCINCGYCEAECPNGAIYEPGMRWSLSDGTHLSGEHTLKNGRIVNADDLLPALSEKYYFIVPDKCAECEGVHDEPQCLVVCPDPESIVEHTMFKETQQDLLDKQYMLNT
jgi:ferredoxin